MRKLTYVYKMLYRAKCLLIAYSLLSRYTLLCSQILLWQCSTLHPPSTHFTSMYLALFSNQESAHSRCNGRTYVVSKEYPLGNFYYVGRKVGTYKQNVGKPISGKCSDGRDNVEKNEGENFERKSGGNSNENPFPICSLILFLYFVL